MNFFVALFISISFVVLNAKASDDHGPAKSIAPDKALGWLKNGNTRFIKPSLRKDGQSKSDIHRLAAAKNRIPSFYLVVIRAFHRKLFSIKN